MPKSCQPVIPQTEAAITSWHDYWLSKYLLDLACGVVVQAKRRKRCVIGLWRVKQDAVRDQIRNMRKILDSVLVEVL